MKYYARNIYSTSGNTDINGTTEHRTPKAAIEAANRRGLGWICLDAEGNRWDIDFDGIVRICRYANPGRPL